MAESSETIKSQILSSLGLPEAEEGLYLRNFLHVHEEDERPLIPANADQILEALNELIRDGKIQVRGFGEEAVFILV